VIHITFSKNKMHYEIMSIQERSNKRMKRNSRKLEDDIISQIFKYDMLRRLVRQAESSDIEQESNHIKNVYF
jgi:hypothetical protein